MLCCKATEDSIAELFKQTDCPLCHLPKDHPKTHNLVVCPLKKKFGFGEIKYDASNDCRCSDYKKKKRQKQQRIKKDLEDKRHNKNKDKDKDKDKSSDNKAKPDPKVSFKEDPNKSNEPYEDGFIEVMDKKKIKSSLKKNGDKKYVNPDGTTMTLAQRNAARSMKSCLDNKQTFLDASEANNDINNKSDIYF